MQRTILRSQNVDEYNSLREELLALDGQTESAWRSGLLQIGAVASAILLERDLVQTVFYSEWSKVLALFLLSIVATGIAWLESWEALRFERAANRIGSFLAVFHDDSEDTANIGWHLWNRVEKNVIAIKIASVRDRKKRRPAPITAAGTRCLIFVPVLLFYFLLLLVYFDIGSLSLEWISMPLAIGLIPLVAFLIWLRKATRRAAKEAIEQTHRWYEIVRLLPELVEKHLEPWGRPPMPRKSSQADRTEC